MFDKEIIKINNYIYNLRKIQLFQPQKNRKILLKYLRNQKGIYIFKTSDDLNLYVGHSINLYSRVNSYFMKSILNSKARKVLRYFNKYGFDYINLIIYILEDYNSIDDLLQLEQYFIDLLKPNLNVDLIARGTGYHTPMSIENRLKLRKERATRIYIYCSFCLNLLFIFNSKQELYDKLRIHHLTLKNCISKGIIYLNNFIITIELVNEYFNQVELMSEWTLINLVRYLKEFHLIEHPHQKTVTASLIIDDYGFKKEFKSINSLVEYLKGDKATIRKYLRKDCEKLYRGK